MALSEKIKEARQSIQKQGKVFGCPRKRSATGEQKII
jgi:hypothetical protein